MMHWIRSWFFAAPLEGAGGDSYHTLFGVSSDFLGGSQRRIGLGARADLRSCSEWYLITNQNLSYKSRKQSALHHATQNNILFFKIIIFVLHYIIFYV